MEHKIVPSASKQSVQELQQPSATKSTQDKEREEFASVVSACEMTSPQSVKRFYSSWDVTKTSKNLKHSSSLELVNKPEALLPNEQKKRKWYNKFGLTSSETRKSIEEGITDNQRKNKTKWYKSSKKIATAL